jgi:hypothetical protein
MLKSMIPKGLLHQLRADKNCGDITNGEPRYLGVNDSFKKTIVS